MAKISGGVRVLQGGSKQYPARELEVQQMINSGKYSSVEFSKKGGGYVAVENSLMDHKPEELDAARFMANKGYKVTLKNEAGEMRTPEGKIFNYSFEQRTPEGNTAKNFTTSLRHARDKKADIALVYMKYNRHTRQSVVDGLKDFEKTSKYRFKQIIVVTPDGRIHRHRHN
jgi:hypothetical protein